MKAGRGRGGGGAGAGGQFVHAGVERSSVCVAFLKRVCRCFWTTQQQFFDQRLPCRLPPLRRIEKATLGTIAQGKYLTRDLGGKSGTSDFKRAIIGNMA